MAEQPMSPQEKINTLTAAIGGRGSGGGGGGGGSDSVATATATATASANATVSDSQTSIGKSNLAAMKRNRYSFNGRKPSFSWLSSTSSINSTTPIKGRMKRPRLPLLLYISSPAQHPSVC